MDALAGHRLDAWLSRILKGGLLALVAVMPFHAFLTVWLGSLVGHRPVLQSWKEVLLLALGLVAAIVWWRTPGQRQHWRQPVVVLTATFIVLGLVVTVFAQPSLTSAIVGFKTDFEFLIAFVIAILAANSRLLRQLTTVTLVAGAVVVGFGLLQSYALPADFLKQFGYGPTTIMPYQVLDPAVDSLRFGSTLGGPNQLGTYLILVVCLALAVGWKRRRWWLLLVPAGLAALVNTHSRSAWIGAAVGLIVVAIAALPRRWRWAAGLSLTGVVIGAVISAVKLAVPGSKLQYYVLHGAAAWHARRGSDYGHLTSLQTGVDALVRNPLGHGLGSAGPAVFHTGSGRIIENYYLQVGYETGLAGMLAFIGLVGMVGYQLGRRLAASPMALALLGALVGISVTALVLPAWTDSTTALVFWILAGVTLGCKREELKHV